MVVLDSLSRGLRVAAEPVLPKLRASSAAAYTNDALQLHTQTQKHPQTHDVVQSADVQHRHAGQ